MVTNKTPTDAEIKEMIPDGDEWKYGVGFAEAIQFARAVLAKWGQPAQAAEPVAWYEYNGDLDAWFLAYSHNPKAKTRPLVFGDAAPQPVAREPLTPERLREIERMHVYAHTATLMDFASAIERAHGIKGG